MIHNKYLYLKCKYYWYMYMYTWILAVSDSLQLLIYQ